MSFDAYKWATNCRVGNAAAKSVLKALADKAGADHLSFPSIAAIAFETELNPKTVQKHLQYLVEKGFTEDTGERRGRTGQIPVYRLIGVPDKTGDVKHTQKREHYQKRYPLNIDANDPKNGIVSNTTKNGNITKNGIVTDNDPKNGVVNANETIPILEVNDPKNGVRILSGTLKPKEIPPIAPQTEQPAENFADLAGEVLDFLNSKINGRTPKRADTLREITERLAEGNSVDELNLVAEHRASQLLNNPELGHMLSARMIFDPTRFGGYLAAAKAWDAKRAKKSAMVAAVEQQRQEPPAGEVPGIDFDDAFDRLLVEGLPPENPAEKSAWQHVQKYGFSAKDEDGARREWRVILTRAYAKTRGVEA